MTEERIIIGTLGQTIHDFAEHLLAEWHWAATIIGVFNDIQLTVTAQSTVESLVDDYHVQVAIQAEAYGQSPEGRETAKLWGCP